MKKNSVKIVVSALLIIAFAFVLVSCGNTAVIKAQTTVMLDAIIANDVDRAYDAMADELKLDKIKFKDDFSKLADYLDGVTEYELKQTSYYTGIQNSISYTKIVYSMSTNVGDFIVTTTVCDGYNGIYNINILAENEVS